MEHIEDIFGQYDIGEHIIDSSKLKRVDIRDKDTKHIKYKFTIPQLQMMCEYVACVNNVKITRPALANISKLFEISDTRAYQSDDTFMGRIDFIKLAIKARLDVKLQSKSAILDYTVRNSMYSDFIRAVLVDDLYNHPGMPNETIAYINTLVHESLIDGSTYYYTDELYKLMQDRHSSAKYRNIGAYATAFKDLVTEINNELRLIERYRHSESELHLGDGAFEDSIIDTMRRRRAPSNKYKTPIRRLNDMLGGGYESGRSYLYLAVTGGGKSIILLLSALWIKMYNKGVTQDPTKKPAVVYITLENGKDESVVRMWNMVVNGQEMEKYSDDDIIAKMRDAGLHVADDANSENNMNLYIKSFPSHTKTVADIDDILTGIESDGCEAVAVVIDFIDRIVPSINRGEHRIVLGDIATELSELAKRRKIPVITAAQLNREAVKVIDNAKLTNKSDYIKLIGTHNTSEAFAMIQNVDVVNLIHKEEDEDTGNEYMTFKSGKFRAKKKKVGGKSVQYFVHPFETDGGLKLVPDIDKPRSVSKNSILDFIDNSNFVNTRKSTAIEPTEDSIASGFDLEVSDLLAKFDLESGRDASDDIMDDLDKTRDVVEETSNRMRDKLSTISAMDQKANNASALEAAFRKLKNSGELRTTLSPNELFYKTDEDGTITNLLCRTVVLSPSNPIEEWNK